jgi:DNA-binding NarL/FixJ family response regulator
LKLTKKILICDDHILFGNGIAEIINKSEIDCEIIVVNSSLKCSEQIKKNSIDVLICDLNIDETDGFTLVESLKNYLEKTKIIILTAYYEDYLIEKAKKAGIVAFLKKETTPDELLRVIEDTEITEFYYQKIKSSNSEFKAYDLNFTKQFRLSKQEKEIIKLIVEGKSSIEISELLFISKTTVSTHRRNINRKLEITNVGSLIKLVHENNILA